MCLRGGGATVSTTAGGERARVPGLERAARRQPARPARRPATCDAAGALVGLGFARAGDAGDDAALAAPVLGEVAVGALGDRVQMRRARGGALANVLLHLANRVEAVDRLARVDRGEHVARGGVGQGELVALEHVGEQRRLADEEDERAVRLVLGVGRVKLVHMDLPSLAVHRGVVRRIFGADALDGDDLVGRVAADLLPRVPACHGRVCAELHGRRLHGCRQLLAAAGYRQHTDPSSLLRGREDHEALSGFY